MRFIKKNPEKKCTEEPTRAAIGCPYCLKEKLKSAFPKAYFNHHKMTWTVPEEQKDAAEAFLKQFKSKRAFDERMEAEKSIKWMDVKIDFDDKDDFKRHFPSCKWDSRRRTWMVPEADYEAAKEWED